MKKKMIKIRKITTTKEKSEQGKKKHQICHINLHTLLELSVEDKRKKKDEKERKGREGNYDGFFSSSTKEERLFQKVGKVLLHFCKISCLSYQKKTLLPNKNKETVFLSFFFFFSGLEKCGVKYSLFYSTTLC